MDLYHLRKLVKLCSDERAFVREEIIPKKKMLGRRMLTHLVIADCETIAYYLKGRVNSDYDEKDDADAIETDYWLASLDDDFVIDEDGGFRVRMKKTRTLPHLLFVLSYAAKYLKKEFDPKKVEGWEHVKLAFGVRDRITHPKEPEALFISDEDLKHVEGLERWLESCLKIIT
jgi:hypothetical protein